MIRVVKKDDAAAMLEIYSPFILNSGITQEITVPSIEEFQKRISETLELRPWIVCEINGDVAGYAYAGKYRDRKGYQWCTEPSVYISEKYLRNNIAHSLYTALFEILEILGYINAYAVITLPNDRSISFHEKFGFEYLTTYKNVGYKLGQWHDVGWWSYTIKAHNDNPSEPTRFTTIDHSVLEKIFLQASSLIKK